MALYVAKTYNQLITAAKEAELNEDLESAAKNYEQAINQEPLDESSYNRLMIIYRKLYQFEDELRVINKGIKSFEDYNQKKSKKIIGKRQKAVQLSNALAKSLGLKDKKGNELFHLEPIAKWMKRKKIVEKKLGR
jgi:tetratricopeptide (TPR) repeat protein